MKTKTVKIVNEGIGYTVKFGKTKLRPTRGVDTYANADSAKRSWRKYAAKNKISNYSYVSA